MMVQADEKPKDDATPKDDLDTAQQIIVGIGGFGGYGGYGGTTVII